MWFDGANGGEGYYGGANEIRKINTIDYYNWDETYKLIYQTAPKTLVLEVGLSEARWIGNEEGRAGKTNWSLLCPKDELAGKVHYTEFMSGHEDGEKWVPGEADVSIRPGWFYHAVALNPVIHAGEVGGSDHVSFYKCSITAVGFHTGGHPDIINPKRILI